MKMFSIKNLISGNLGGMASGIGNASFKKVQQGAMSGGFPRTLNKAQLWAVTGSDITVSTSWIRIGEYTIPAQQRIHVGYGVSGGNPEEIGHMHFDLVDDTATNSAAEAGYVRLGYTNASETMTCIVFEGRTEELSDTSSTVGISRSDELLLPETSPEVKGFPDVLAGEDSKLIVDFKSDAADIIAETGIGTGAINVWRLPITVYQ